MPNAESDSQPQTQPDAREPSPKPDVFIVRRLLYALMVGDPAWADERVDFIRVIAHVDTSDVDGRVWWRIPRHINDPEGWDPGYVSLDPGEFRGTPPDGPRDIIRDAPVSSNPLRLSELLKTQLQRIDAHADELTDELRLLKQQAEKLLQNLQTNDYSEALNIFREESLRLKTNSVASAQETVNNLYEKCFLSFLMPGTLFAMAMALLQIQMGVNLWIEEDVYSDVRSHLGSFVGDASKSYPTILEGAAKIGNWHFEDGQKCLKEALASVTLDTFYHKLYLAAHHFWAACAIAKDSEETMPPGQLNYTTAIAEESYSCVITGVHGNLVDLALGNRDDVEARLIDYFEQDNESEAQRFVRDLTRPTNPILPKHYARVSMARAMVSVGERWVHNAIKLLHSLEEEFHAQPTLFENSSREYYRIESGLMVAYRDIGDEERAKEYATKIIGRALVSRAFGKF